MRRPAAPGEPGAQRPLPVAVGQTRPGASRHPAAARAPGRMPRPENTQRPVGGSRRQRWRLMWSVWSSSDGWWRRAVLASATMGTRLAKLAGRALRPGPPFVRSWVLGEMIAYARGLAPLAPASIRIRCRRYRMAESGQHQYIEVNDDDRTVASAEVTSDRKST